MNNLFKYFTPKYRISYDESTFYIYLNLYAPDSSIAIQVTYVNDKVYESKNYLNEEYTKKFIDYIKSDEDFKKEYSFKKEKFNEINKARMLRELNDAIDSFESNRYLKTQALKLGIDFELEVDYDNVYLLGKIGGAKKYVIKSFGELAYRFQTNAYYKYGKDLSFYHDLDILDEKSRHIMEEIMKLNIEYMTNTRKLHINDFFVNDIIRTLVNSYLTIDGVKYLVTLDKYEFKPRIDDKYVWSSNVNYESVFKVDAYSYYLDKYTNTIFLLSDNANESKLIDLCARIDGQSIEPIKEKFKSKVLLPHKEHFEISPSIEDSLHVEEVVVDAYFDMEDGKITADLKYKVRGEEVLDVDMPKYNSYKAQQFVKLLNELGFVDNTLDDGGKMLAFLSLDFSKLRDLANIYLSDSISKLSLERFAAPVLRMNYHNNLFEMFFEESNYSEEELEEIYRAIKRKKKYILLHGDHLIDLTRDEASDFADIVDDAHLDPKRLNERQERPLYQALNVASTSAKLKKDEFLYKMVNDIATFKDRNESLPLVNATLRDYQVDAYKWLSVLNEYNLSGILADDMGLGKTLEVITLLEGKHQNKPSLIVCPKSLKFKWVSEVEKFTKSTDACCIYGTSQRRAEIIKGINYEEYKLYITAYDSLIKDQALYTSSFDYIILDEAQAIKNVFTGKSRAVKELKSDHKLCLTGTPIENNIYDLWNLFDFLMPDFFDALNKFKSSFNWSDSYLNRIKRKVSPFILRRTKTDVLDDLPPKSELILQTDMTPAQRKIYDSYRLQAKKSLDGGASALDVLKHLVRLRQICVDPKTFLEDYTGNSGKMQMLNEILNEYLAKNHRILIFSQFVQALNIVKDDLNKLGIKHLMLTGDTKVKERLSYCNTFNSSNEYKVFLISLKAGGTGLNLTGADTVIHLDPWWNNAVMSQANDRAHRIGQSKTVTVLKLIASDSIEQRVIELQNKKKDLIDKLISNDDSSITSISRDDLKYILE